MPCGFEELNAKINRLKRDGGVGFTEVRQKSPTFDGDMTGKEFFPLNETAYMVRVSDEPFSFDGLKHISVTMGSISAYLEKDQLRYEEDEETAQWSAFSGGVENPLIMVLLKDFDFDDGTIRKGVFVQYESASGLMVEKVVYTTETIHPISDKYLPEGFGGGGLPVVIDLTPYGFITNGTQIPDGSQYDEVLDAIEKSRAIYVKMNVKFDNGFAFSNVGLYVGLTQKTSDTALVLSATTAFADIDLGGMYQTASQIVLTPQGMRADIAFKPF